MEDAVLTATSVPSDRANPRPIAPIWHTVIVLVVVLLLSLLSARSQSLSPVRHWHGRVVSYVFAISFEWLLTAFIWFGVRNRGGGLAELIGGSWPGVRSVLRDLGIAVLFLIASNVVLATFAYLLRATQSQRVRNVFPSGHTEVAFYLLLTVTAGICEEIIFRGYLQRQFAALTKSNVAGLMLQAVAFGAAHGYQGKKFMVIIAVYGCLFGWLANRQRSLRPGMITHFLQDSVVGLVGRHLVK